MSRIARRDLLTGDERRALFGVPLDRASLAKHYTVADDDRALIKAKRGDANRLGFALHLAHVRHPGFGMRHDEVVPDFLVRHVAEQLGLRAVAFTGYARRAQAGLEHAWEAMQRLGLRAFGATDVPGVLGAAARAAEGTERGSIIASAVVDHMGPSCIVLPAPARIGVAGRAMARRTAADIMVDALTESQVAALDALLVVDTEAGLLARLAHVRSLGLDGGIAERVHEHRFEQLVREGQVAPAFLLSDYSLRRRRATLAAAMLDMEARLADAAIEMFDKQTGLLFAKAKAARTAAMMRRRAT